MRILLVGEAAEHAADLRPHLHEPHDVIGLPIAAANSARYDATIEPDDVVVSLRFSRPHAQAPPFRLLQVPGAGLDGIELDALRPSTALANVYEHEIPISEYVLARLLEWEIRAGQMRESFTPEAWPELYRRRSPHGEVYGKAMGIVGYGRIGRAIAARASAFGIRTVAVDNAATSDNAATVVSTAQLPGVLAGADYLVIACPLTAQTTGLIDRAALRRMPRHAVLVNVSRAQIVDQNALYDALRDEDIAGAVLDVWYHYPGSAGDQDAPASRPFWELPNAWCTPHSCAWTHQLAQRRYAFIAENINRLASGRPLLNLVRAGVPPGAQPSTSKEERR
jgi:phosphoglycerate dehydrogenase-like enzyme